MDFGVWAYTLQYDVCGYTPKYDVYFTLGKKEESALDFFKKSFIREFLKGTWTTLEVLRWDTPPSYWRQLGEARQPDQANSHLVPEGDVELISHYSWTSFSDPLPRGCSCVSQDLETVFFREHHEVDFTQMSQCGVVENHKT